MLSSEPSPQRSPVKRTLRQTSHQGKWSEEQLLTSDKSPLVDADLIVCFNQQWILLSLFIDHISIETFSEPCRMELS